MPRKYTVAGLSVAAVCRWMGSRGLAVDEAMSVLATHGIYPSRSMVKVQIGSGRRDSDERCECSHFPQDHVEQSTRKINSGCQVGRCKCRKFVKRVGTRGFIPILSNEQEAELFGSVVAQ